MADRPSGRAWVNDFPTSRSLDDLKEPFRTNAQKFLSALDDAGADVTVSATVRPPERAYLMHFSFLIAHGFDPGAVPPMTGVDIDWAHRNASGVADRAAATTAAKDMVAGYDIAFAPALHSRHTDGLAIDMTISWDGDLVIDDARGTSVTVSGAPRSGGNTALQRVGATYDVHKLPSDPPHWSSDGH